MAYGRINTNANPMQDQSDAYDEAFPPLQLPHPSAPASSDDLRQNFPYKVPADRLCAPGITLRPSLEPGLSSDPLTASMQGLQSTLDDLSALVRRQVAPWIIPPPDAEMFTFENGIVIPAQAGAFAPIFTFTVPEGRNGVLKQIANVFIGGGFTDYSGLIVWQIWRNPPAVPGAVVAAERNYENIIASLGSASNPGNIGGPNGGIRIFENDVIVLAVKNVNIVVAAQTIAGLLGGWFYPRTWDDQADRQRQAAW